MGSGHNISLECPCIKLSLERGKKKGKKSVRDKAFRSYISNCSFS